MKKLPTILIFTVIASVLGALLIEAIRRRTTAITVDPDILGDDSAAVLTFRNFNYNKLLNANAVHAEPEITALQHLINAYYDEPVLVVTGRYDAATKEAVINITGKASTNLYEFRYLYFVPKRGDTLAGEILKSLTTPAA